MAKRYLVIDFDSTLVEVEALDELAVLAMAGDPKGREIAEEIARITALGMEGKIAFDESLETRLKLLSAGKGEVAAVIALLRRRITPSFKANSAFFARNCDQVLVMSSGFKDYIVPVVADLHIESRNVFANSFIYGPDGRIIGYDRTNPLSQAGGKSKQLLDLDLKGEIYVIGDGYTDWQMIETGRVTKFIAYVGNVARPGVAERANHVIEDFDAFLRLGYF